MATDCQDYDYIVRTIQYLDKEHGIWFFITSKDFDVLYRWWEKGIPTTVVMAAINRVVDRWKVRNKPITSFSNFSYEVKKGYQSFLDLQVGRTTSEEKKPDYLELEDFIKHIPQELKSIKGEFEKVLKAIKERRSIELFTLHKRLLSLFSDDEELEKKTNMFLRHLAPELRQEKIIERFRLNYLLSRFKIPFIRLK